MAFSGKMTAANHADLLAQITAYITGDPAVPGRDWTVARQDTLEWGPATVFGNTGLAGSEEVYVGLHAATHGDGVRGGLVCKVYKRFDPAPLAEGGTAFFDTVYGNGNGSKDTVSLLPCWNAGVNFWVWSNKARVLVVVDCNGLYGNAYLGQLRRFCLPSENPWPLACLTDGYTNFWTNTSWHDSAQTKDGTTYKADVDRRSLPFVRRGCYPVGNYSYYQACHQVCRPDGVWTSHFVMCPTASLLSRVSINETDAQIDTLGTALVTPDGGKRCLLPLYVMLLEADGSTATSPCLLGEPYGVRWAPDSLAATGSDVDGFILFPDVNRTEWHSFMAVGDE